MKLEAILSRAVLGGFALLGILRCTEGPTETAQGGGGSEAVALVGAFEYPDHEPAIGASVRLRPRLFLSDTAGGAVPASAAGTVLDAVTGADGAFRMDSVKRGDYFLEIS